VRKILVMLPDHGLHTIEAVSWDIDPTYGYLYLRGEAPEPAPDEFPSASLNRPPKGPAVATYGSGAWKAVWYEDSVAPS
jgi:hypothetical protein